MTVHTDIKVVFLFDTNAVQETDWLIQAGKFAVLKTFSEKEEKLIFYKRII